MKHLAMMVMLAVMSTPTWADADLAKKKNCMACHAVDKKLVGPAYRDVARRYQGNASAVTLLAKKIQVGGKDVWGPIPMPANPHVTESEARALATWILKQ